MYYNYYRMVNLEWYRTFVAVYHNSTLTKAAEILYSSQPGVSLHVNSLETYVGKKLFERTSRKMIPTEEGKQLYGYIIEAVEKLEKAEQHFKKTSSTHVPSIHIGMCTETFQSILEAEVPNLPFDLVAKFGSHQELIRDLENGILDLVISPTQKNSKNATVEYEAFSQENIVLVAGAKNNIADLKPLIQTKNWEKLSMQLKQHTWYSASNEMEHFRRFWYDNFNKRADFKPNYILPNISSIIRCISNNKGLAIVPDFLVNEALKNKQIYLLWKGKKKVNNTLYFAVRKDLNFKKEVEVIKNIFLKKMGEHSK